MFEAGQEKLQANAWLITARWYYTIGIFLFFLTSLLGESWTANFPVRITISLFALGLLFNVFFLLILRDLKRTQNWRDLPNLSLAQVAMELIFFLLITHLSGGVLGIAPALFFIPIVASITLFDPRGPIWVAVASTLLVNVLVLLEYGGLLERLGGFFGLVVTTPNAWSEAWVRVALISLVYLIVGLFAGYTARLIKHRNDLLAEKLTEEKNKIKDIEHLNQELTDYTKELFDKDFELTLANKRLQMLEAAKSKFVSVTTHQLRTPLAAIKWTFHMLLQESLGKINAEQKDFLKKGYDSAQRIISIINDLLNIDYIEANKLDYHFLAVKLEELMDGLILEFTNHAESKKIKLVFSKPDRPLPTVMIDPIKISMVLENLIDNAIKYTKLGGQVRVVLSDDRSNSASAALEISVADNGIGIPAAEQEKIFHRFFRASNAVRAQPDGSGLGLFISRDIIQKHGGQLWFESKEGEGSVFHFTIPIHRN